MLFLGPPDMVDDVEDIGGDEEETEEDTEDDVREGETDDSGVGVGSAGVDLLEKIRGQIYVDMVEEIGEMDGDMGQGGGEGGGDQGNQGSTGGVDEAGQGEEKSVVVGMGEGG